MTASPHPGPASDPGDLKDLKRDVEDTVEVAVERGRGFAAAARAHALGFAETRKDEAARSVSDIANTLRDSSKTFDDRPNVKAFFDSAAEGLDDLAGSIESRSIKELYEDAEAFARRSPVTVAVATFAAGLLLARFVKASGERHIDADYSRERV
ncbi:hypothetical protein [Methylobacterium gnaphalii]|uniref:DUF883 domain-containing protein n=1 Tax=Methylobacterium gnaphalii TaxID=1010610 RepID=A0A512JFT1_9HYPH|nr:hypothetical protein [Methylobacterium gnaphalii]GEP08800.1 hypothetical protein MGN01_06450 [Methylobacterium gnaphalii]GJD69390.1 hypothetical protein MMMDOFMJ_2321 [Methylobacterium gnaphalii]GLS47566.1 hypothetical protein GCM10007885_04100 [Methylobacterium gnaphalii]